MESCINCLTFFYKAICCCGNKADRSLYMQNNIPEVRSESSIEAENKEFEFDLNQIGSDLEQLKYENLIKQDPLSSNLNSYIVSIDLEGYKMITKRHYNLGDRREIQGFKIHIAIDNRNNNISVAWNIVMPFLVQYGIHDFKVILNNNLDNYQLGKEIVIYEMSSKPGLNWQELLNKIEKNLIEAQVKTANESPKHRLGKHLTFIPEPCIDGSKYLYYTDDRINCINKLQNYDWNTKENPFLEVTIDSEITQHQISSSSHCRHK